MPRCLSTRLGGFDGLRARLATSAMKNLAACHDRHVRCDPAAWSITWKLTLRADGSVTDVRATRAPPPLMECVTKTLRSFTWETCARTVTLSLILTTMRGRATPACVQ